MLGSGTPLMNPISAAWNTVARFDDYESAQRAVDRLSDDGFPVEKLDIVGSGLRLVERVTGRLTRSRAAGAGALSGMWAGLLFGILLGLFTSGHSFLAVAARVVVSRPVTRSTSRRPDPTMSSFSTGKPSSDSRSTARWALS